MVNAYNYDEDAAMFLQKLMLENVRCIRELSLPFVDLQGGARKWTLLLGDNGCGKSTILRAIALLLSGSEALVELLGDPDSWIRSGCKECAIHAELLTAVNQKRSISLRLRRRAGLRNILEQNKEWAEFLDTELASSATRYLTLGYGVSRRLSSERPSILKSEVFRHRRARSVATLFWPDAPLNPIESWAMDLHYRHPKEGMRVIRDGLRNLLPGVEFSHISRERRELRFRTVDGEVSLAQLSDGCQNMASWFGDLLYRVTEAHKDKVNPLRAQGLLLIDEIGLHLHPTWQRRLRSFLDKKLPNFQIVATTHSPLAAHQAGEGELYVLRRPRAKDPPSLDPYPGEARRLMLHQLLLSPVFGLTTVDSLAIEKLRKELARLRRKKPLSSAERVRLSQIRRELEDQPEWGAESAHERKRRTLLQQIRSALQAQRKQTR